MPKPMGRPKLLEDPSPVLVRIESWERSHLEQLAAERGVTLTDVLRHALRRHIRQAIDDGRNSAPAP